MGTLKIVSYERHRTLVEISPPFKFNGKDISNIIITNENDRLFMARPCGPDGVPVTNSWYYTSPGITLESLYKIAIKLKSLNSNAKSNNNKKERIA
jgi:hypothetical protein